MKRIDEFGYWVVNADNKLDEAIEQIMAILCAERQRVDRELIKM